MERVWVPVVGTVAVLAFVFLELTGSGADKHVGQVTYTALLMILLIGLGSVGIALAHFQPRFALLGVVTAMLSLLAFGALVVEIWDNGIFLFGFGLGDTAAKVAIVTLLLAVATSGICGLLATARPGDEGGIRVTRLAGVVALAALVALASLAIADPSFHLDEKFYGYLASVYIVATGLLLFVRLLPGSRTA